MYVAPAARSESRLSAPFHEYDVWRSDSLDEYLGRPSYFRDQRVRLDLQLVHVLRISRTVAILAKLNVIARYGVRANIGFRAVPMPVDRFVECQRVVPIRSKVETCGEFPRLRKGRAFSGVHVRPRQAGRHSIVPGVPAGG